MFVKVCGLKSERAVRAAVEAGADALGFVFARSPRQVSPEQAVALTCKLPAGIVRVAVMLHPSIAEWNRVLDVFKPDWLQADADDFALLSVPAHVMRLPVYRDKAPHAPEQPGFVWPEHLLFEGARSGAGLKPDWNIAARFAGQTKMLLAGGLNPENVREAIRMVHPWGVDVSSGVESSPGIKDPERIAAFIAAARQNEGAHAGRYH
jgi:phosphoribosylanthranilate isomerase